MIIRLVEEKDTEAVVGVVHACFMEYGFTWDPIGEMGDLYSVTETYVPPDAYFWVAEVEGQVIGTGALELYDRLEGQPDHLIPGPPGQTRVAGSDCSLERLYVHPDHRRIGAGLAMLEHVIENAKALNRETMEIWSDVKLTKAHALYAKLGAIQLGERLLGDADNSTEFGLALRLR